VYGLLFSVWLSVFVFFFFFDSILFYY